MAGEDRARVALIGYGLAGRVFHAPLVASTPGLELAAIVTGDKGRAAAARARFPAAEVLPDADAVLRTSRRATGRFDLVVVATPNDSHVPLATRAIEAGIATVVDKPLAVDLEGAQRLVELAARAEVALTVFHNRRWDDDFLTLRDLVESGRLGRVHRFESRYERWRPQVRRDAWREDPDPARGGGLLLDLGSHLVDQALVLFGPVASVYAELDRRRDGAAVDDDVFLALEHTSGVRSHLWMGALVAQLGPRFRVLGDAAGFTKFGIDPQESQLAAGLRPGAPGWGVAGAAVDGSLGVGEHTKVVATRPGAYERFYGLVADALARGTPMPVDPHDAIETLRVVAAARVSARDRVVARLARA